MPTPTLTVEETAVNKLLYLYDKHKLEVGGFGIAPDGDKPFEIANIRLFPQSSTSASIDADTKTRRKRDTDFLSAWDDKISEFAADGLTFDQFARVWTHIQPGSSTPTGTDWDHFDILLRAQRDSLALYAKLNPDKPCPQCWMIMLVFAAYTGNATAYFGQYSIFGFPVFLKMDVKIHEEYQDTTEWDTEFEANVKEEKPTHPSSGFGSEMAYPLYDPDTPLANKTQQKAQKKGKSGKGPSTTGDPVADDRILTIGEANNIIFKHKDRIDGGLKAVKGLNTAQRINLAERLLLAVGAPQ
jgi:hypothetical protein